MKKYQIIYADPPWSYRDKALAGNRGANCKYPTQSKEWIESLPIKEISDNNCCLFLWVTMPKLNEVFDLFRNWGFEYKTCAFVWIKTNNETESNQASFVEDNFASFVGMGSWTRANAELCLLGTKGKPKRIDASVRQIIYSPIQRHSKKPKEAKERIVSLVGNLPRIELFAREKHEGWDVWGNEVDSDIELKV